MSERCDMPLKDGLFGDWEKVGRWFNEKSTTMSKFGNAPLDECAELYYKILTEGIRSQSFEWTKLSDVYLKRKIAKGYGAKTLIATGSYLDGISIQRAVTRGDKVSVFVGADPRAIHEPSGLLMSYLGAIHEYGTRDGRIPARPHYRPAWERCRVQCRNIWLRHFREFVRVK